MSFLGSLDNFHQFEQLCYELIQRSGFRNPCWRGPGSDGGRDIEAEWQYVDPAGHYVSESWYIECKFYNGSLPFQDVQPKLLAAWRDGKDCLLVITSSDIRNTCVDAIRTWISENGNRPRFRYWNGHDVTHRLLQHSDLIEHYFPNLQVAPSVALRQQILRQAEINTGLQNRFERHLTTLTQSIHGRILNTVANTPELEHICKEVELLLYSISALKCLTDESDRVGSVQSVNIATTTREVVQCFDDRGLSITVESDGSEPHAEISRPLMFAALYELVDNAIRFHDSTVSLAVNESGQQWSVSIWNDHSMNGTVAEETLLTKYRHPLAMQRHPSGSGLGCNIVQKLLSRIGCKVTWDLSASEWNVEITGPIHSSV